MEILQNGCVTALNTRLALIHTDIETFVSSATQLIHRQECSASLQLEAVWPTSHGAKNLRHSHTQQFEDMEDPRGQEEPPSWERK